MGVMDTLSGGSLRKAGIAFFAVLLVVGMGPAAAVSAADLNFDDESGAPNPYADVGEVTVSDYNVAWGDSLQYEADDGSVTDLPADLNRSTDVDDLGSGSVNPFTFALTDVNFTQAGEFPRKSEGDNAASALDASEYTTSGATMSDVSTAPGVDAVEFAASASGDSATYDNFSITSDAEKRYFQAIFDVSESGASEVTVTIHDATDGDTATVYLYDADGNTSDANVAANTTGEGKAIQVQMGKLTASGGDGTIDEIGQFVISANGAANVDASAINLEKTGKWNFGERYVNTDTSDDDEDLETETIYQATGPISVHSVTTMGSTFDDADIKGLSFPAHFEAKHLASDDVDVAVQSGSDAGYPGWDKQSDIYYRITLPDAYDLSYSNVELKADQKYTETHYKTVEYAEGTGDTAFDDIGDSEWSGITSSFSSKDTTVTVDSTVQPGTSMVLHFSNTWTDGEWSSITSGPAQSGGGGSFQHR